MKFIKQLSEDEFVVKLGKEDADNTRKIVLAHDYLQFSGRDWHCTDFHGLNSPCTSGNVIHTYATIQIPIRMAQDMLEKVLTSDRKYLRKDHLFYNNGKKGYCDPAGLSYRYTNDYGTKMIAIYDGETDEYVHIPFDVYSSICKTVKEQYKSE